jgi:cytochrome c-type biogenesis protein CcmH/NrfG
LPASEFTAERFRFVTARGGRLMVFATLLAVALAAVAAAAWWLLRARRMPIGNWVGVVALATWLVGVAAAQWWPKTAPQGRSELVQSLDSLAWPVAPKSPLVDTTRPGQGAAQSAGAVKAAPVQSLVSGLEARLSAEPNDGNGWALLAQSYAYMADKEAVDNAVKRAVALGVDEPSLRERVNRAMQSAHGGDWVEQTLRTARQP